MKISNNLISAEIKNAGAELMSLKRLDNNCEYIWGGDKQYWASHSPVLFPIVCAARNGEIIVNGKAYKIGNHGFARKTDFELVESHKDMAVFKLESSDATLAMYPYKFILWITFTLEANKIKTSYTVENTDSQSIYFQIGTHPGFNCPLDSNGSFNDYYIEFEKEEMLDRLFMNSDNLLISDKSDKIGKTAKLPLTRELFEHGALVFKNIRSGKISLKSSNSDKSATVSYSDMPNLGLWQAKDAPFVCIEPWHGIADYDNKSGEFKDKEMVVELKQGAKYESWYAIELI